MTIKQQGGIFGRNPTFNDVTVEGDLTTEGGLTTTGDIISSEEGINTPTADGITVERPTGSAPPTPVELRMSSTTQASDWYTSVPWGRVAFYSKDTSGGGGKIHGSMEIRAAHSSGGRSRLAFKTSSNSADDLQDALIIDPDQGSGRNVTVSDGNLVIGTSGQGIDFSATSGTGTSELFDDYEEGTWTPTYVASTTNPTFSSYGLQTGYYTKVGELVYVSARMRTNGYNSDGAGNLRIGGLPYASASIGTLGSGGAISILGSLSFTSNPAAGYFISGGNYIQLNSNTLFTAATVSALDTGTADNDISFFGVYRAS